MWIRSIIREHILSGKSSRKLGWALEPDFLIPAEALAHLREAVSRGEGAEAEWDSKFQDCGRAHSGAAPLAVKAGARVLAAGSAVFSRAMKVGEAMKILRESVVL